jgi:hypothetical protein
VFSFKEVLFADCCALKDYDPLTQGKTAQRAYSFRGDLDINMEKMKSSLVFLLNFKVGKPEKVTAMNH